MHFQLNEAVRVVSNCTWLNSRGVVVEILERKDDTRNGVSFEEYAVMFSGRGRCWFMADHLVKSLPTSMICFFRSEVAERWKQLDRDLVATLQGEREGLIALLCDQYDFSIRRAAAEVDEFLVAFDGRIERAVSSDQPEKSGIAAA